MAIQSITDIYQMVGGSFVHTDAYIKIRDLRSLGDDAISLMDSEKASGQAAAGFTGLPPVVSKVAGKQLNDLKEQAANAAKSAAAKGISSVVGTGLGDINSKKLKLGGGPRNDDYDKIFVVQFNPSSLRISSQGSGLYTQKNNYGASAGTTSIEMAVTKPHVELSVQLIFDSLEHTYRAFASDLGNLSTTNLIDTGVDLAMRAVTTANKLGGNEGLGVQPAVEGFVGAMRNKYTRQVCFEWGDLYYEGELKSINATYTMFDSVGKPVRAKVDMSLYLLDDKVKGGDMGHWEQAYDLIFKNSNVLDLGGSAIGNAAKSLINF